MKVFAISDLHLSDNNKKPMNIFGPQWDNYLKEIEADWNKKVTDDDIVLIAGDISWAMKLEEVMPDLEYIAKFKGKKVIIKGNHDYWWSSISKLRSVLPVNMFALQNDAIKFNNIVVCGSRGWLAPEKFDKSTNLDEKIYKRELIRLELSLQKMQKIRNADDIVIAMLHYPPTIIKSMQTAVTQLLEKYQVNKVVFGHLHSYDKNTCLNYTLNDVEYFLTSCDLLGNKLVQIL